MYLENSPCGFGSCSNFRSAKKEKEMVSVGNIRSVIITSCVCIHACANYIKWRDSLMKMDEHAVNERDYKNDHDMAYAAKNDEE